MQNPWILAADIDHTLTGDPEALARLAARLAELRRQRQLLLFLSTGRRLEHVLAGFEEEGIPVADAIISQVGTEIYLPPFAPDLAPLPAWDARLHRQFARRQALAFLEGIDGLEMQPEKYNTALKVSCYLDKAPDPDAAADRVRQRVAEARNGYQVVWSSGKHLDIIPAAAGKGKAIRFLIGHLHLTPRQVIVAGDSGNDRSMFEEFAQGIIVANAQPELKRWAETSGAPAYLARQSFAAGVEEGLRHFGVL